MKTHTTSDNYISIEKTEFEFMCDPNSNHGRKTPLESFYSLCAQTSVFQVNQKEQMWRLWKSGDKYAHVVINMCFHKTRNL